MDLINDKELQEKLLRKVFKNSNEKLTVAEIVSRAKPIFLEMVRQESRNKFSNDMSVEESVNLLAKKLGLVHPPAHAAKKVLTKQEALANFSRNFKH